MSQLYKSQSATPEPPQVLTSVTTDVRDNTTTGPGTAIPAANNLQILGISTTQNNVYGIRTDANPNNGNIVYVELTNRATGSTQTVAVQTKNLITLALGSTPGVYTFDITIAAFASGGVGAPAGAGYTIVGSVRTDGATATLIPTQVVDHFEEAALVVVAQPTAVLAVSGNNALVQVTGASDGSVGPTGFTIDWVGTLLYTFAS